MRKISQNRVIEAVIVILLVGILLTLFIPKFQDAQVTAKIARAKRDLDRIIQTVDIMQNDLEEEEFLSIHLFNDKLGHTQKKTIISTFDNHPKKVKLKPELETSFFKTLGEIPTQQLPLQFEQDWHNFPAMVDGKRVGYRHYGFKYEKNQFGKPRYMTLHYETDPETILAEHPKLPEPYHFAMVQYPPNVNTYRSMAHTAGPVLIREFQPIPAYDPSNGLLSHGILFQFTTTDEAVKTVSK